MVESRTNNVHKPKQLVIFWFLVAVVLYVLLVFALKKIQDEQTRLELFQLQQHLYAIAHRGQTGDPPPALATPEANNEGGQLRQNFHPALDVPLYYINLNRSVDRRLRLEDEFKLAGIPNVQVTRVPAINGAGLQSLKHGPLEAGDQLKFQNDFSSLLPGEVACTLSHLVAIRQAYQDGHELALICEDDVSFHLMPLWSCSLTELASKLDQHTGSNGWSTLNLMSLKRVQPPFGNTFGPTKPLSTTTAYLINRRGMELALSRSWDQPTRTFHLDQEVSPRGEADSFIYDAASPSYSCVKPLVYTVMSGSTISQSHDDSTHSHCWHTLQQYKRELKELLAQRSDPTQ
jgi:GR25 family glycosyltransferase involved in LPS biosynthesis